MIPSLGLLRYVMVFSRVGGRTYWMQFCKESSNMVVYNQTSVGKRAIFHVVI